MSTKDQPHYTLHANVLAEWLELQGSDSWWTVDGDPWLTQRVSFPCPGDELAIQIRSVGKDLFLLDVDDREDACGQSVARGQIDSLAFQDAEGRAFQFSWKGDPSNTDWNLVEDKESAALARAETMEG